MTQSQESTACTQRHDRPVAMKASQGYQGGLFAFNYKPPQPLTLIDILEVRAIDEEFEIMGIFDDDRDDLGMVHDWSCWQG